MQRRALHSFKKLICNSDQKTLMYNVGDYRSYRGVGYKTHKLESKINAIKIPPNVQVLLSKKSVVF